MAVTMRTSALTRRRFLAAGVSSTALAAVGIAKPALSRAADRPLITHGIQSGDVSTDAGIVWARADRPSRMLVEVATTDSFRDVRAGVFVDALPETDFTAKALIEGLPAGQDMFYRIRFQDHSFPTLLSAPQIGRFRTAPSERRNVSFVWSGDTAGGWGIDEARGGMRTYATMLKCRPDFFIHSGDHIYADCPIQAERKLPDGGVWKNIVTEEKSKIAQTLAEFRGNYKYNLLDKNLLAFNAEVPLLAQWDDHEVTNDWCPGEAPGWRGYVDKSILTWRRADAAPSTNSCRCARPWPKPGGSTARSPTGRYSISSCWTCAPIARLAARTTLPRRSWGRRRCPGSNASS